MGNTTSMMNDTNEPLRDSDAKKKDKKKKKRRDKNKNKNDDVNEKKRRVFNDEPNQMEQEP